MFGVSFPELVVVFVVLLLAVGPERLPKTARTVGEIVGRCRRTTDSLRREMYNALYPPFQEPPANSAIENSAIENRAIENRPLPPERSSEAIEPEAVTAVANAGRSVIEPVREPGPRSDNSPQGDQSQEPRI